MENLSQKLPIDIDAERNYLGCLLLDGSLFSIEENNKINLTTDDFAIEKHKCIYDAIIQRASSSDDFSPTVLANDLENNGKLEKAGGRNYLLGLIDIDGNKYSFIEYAKIIKDKSRRRKLILVAENIIKISNDPDGRSVDDIFDEAQGLVFNLADNDVTTDSGPQSVIPLAANMISKWKEGHSEEALDGVHTGFSDFDALTHGLQPGSLNIIAARPSVGKTSFAMNIVQNIATNPAVSKPALVFSLEMPAEQLIRRMLCSFARTSIKNLIDNAESDPSKWYEIIRKLSLLSFDSEGKKLSKLYIDDTPTLTPLELRSRARKIAAINGGLSVIMVDYIQLMRGQTKTDNRVQEVGEISRSLKLLAKDLNVPVIALSQLNRAVDSRKDHRPMNSDLRESGSIEQDADVIMFLHREYIYKTEAERLKDDGEAWLIVSKNRSGGIADIPLKYQSEYTTFYDAKQIDSTQYVE